MRSNRLLPVALPAGMSAAPRPRTTPARVPARARDGSRRPMPAAATDAGTENGLPPPSKLAIVGVDPWPAAADELPAPRGGDTPRCAKRVPLGAWIDGHIAATGREPLATARATALGLLTSTQVTAAT